jgi:hypothetical protein
MLSNEKFGFIVSFKIKMCVNFKYLLFKDYFDDTFLALAFEP